MLKKLSVTKLFLIQLAIFFCSGLYDGLSFLEYILKDQFGVRINLDLDLEYHYNMFQFSLYLILIAMIAGLINIPIFHLLKSKLKRSKWDGASYIFTILLTFWCFVCLSWAGARPS